jgi:hypothetical protein
MTMLNNGADVDLAEITFRNIPYGIGMKELVTIPSSTDPEETVEIDCIFDNEYQAQILNNFEFESSAPMILVKENEAKHLTRNNPVIIRTTNYKVSEKQPDGTGFLIITLKK